MEGVGWLQWKQHPKTQEFLSLLKQSVETVKDQWLEGAYRSSDHMVEAKLTAAALSNGETLQRLVLAIEDIQAPEEKTHE